MTLTVEQTRARSTDRGETMRLTEVTENDHGFSLLASHSGFGLSREYGVTPEVGDAVTLYTHRGSMIRGLDLNGTPVFYKTHAELDEDHRHYVEAENRRRDEELEAQRDEREADFSALPEVFQRRIKWFRAHNPRFRQDFEPYEMSACLDAVRLAEWAASEADPGEAIREFQQATCESQREMVPQLAYDRHSDNSFGFAVRLAHHYVTEPENVYQEHGAMTPLVGCLDYGCVHPRD